MSEPCVREIGRVTDMDGVPVIIGVDYDTMVVNGCRLLNADTEEFARLFVSACWQAAEQWQRMHAEADGAVSYG